MKNDNQNNEFIEKCREINFSAESVNQEKNLEILKAKLNQVNKERDVVVNRKIRKPVALVAVVAALLCFSMAVYGQELVRIIKTVTLGAHAEYIVVEDNREFVPIPEDIRGLVFDKEGNELAAFPDDGILYNENGEEVRPLFENGKTRLMTDEEFKVNDQARKANWFITNDLEEGKGYFICESLSPSYLPDGYVFDRIEFYGDPVQPKDSDRGVEKYMGVYYSNGQDEIYSQVRYMDEETAFGSSASNEIKKIKINGYDAIVDGNALDIQIGDVMYMFFANENLDGAELVKIAESLQ